MNYLLLSILLNGYIGVVFVFFNKYKVDLFQAIVFNYITCVITGSVVIGHFPLQVSTIDKPWFKFALLMGALFISVFNIIAVSSVKAGVTATQTSNKLSLIIPVLFSWYFYHENIGWVKWLGIALALVAVIFTISKDKKSIKQKSLLVYLLPLILFIGSGIIDTLTKYAEKHFIKNDATANAYLIAGFFVAAFIGSLLLLFLYIFGKKKFHYKHLAAGIILGIPNYFSIFYLIKALGSDALSSSAIIPINNIGVLFVVSLFGIFIFKEKISRLNYFGILLTIVAILLIYYGDKI
ncbi:MAG: DMT family transporter [Chitinophagaceae bacterium]|nr:DMT family transporter [Chitinophagaceae bacterium]